MDEKRKNQNYSDALYDFLKGQLHIVANNFQNQNRNTIHYLIVDNVLQAKLSLASTEPLIKFRFSYKIENNMFEYRRRLWGTILPKYIRFAVDIFNPTGEKWSPKQEKKIKLLKAIKRITNQSTAKERKAFEKVCQPYLKYFGIPEIDKLTFAGKFDDNTDYKDLSIGFRITNDFDGLLNMVIRMARTMPVNAFRPRWDDYKYQ